MSGRGDESGNVQEMVASAGPLPGTEEGKESEDGREVGRECLQISRWSEFGVSQGQALSSHCPRQNKCLVQLLPAQPGTG